jgi:2-hydroxychromene-2-carboxylate isomerase
MDVPFYFGPGSRYSYLAATQLDRVAAETGARFVWRGLFSGDLIARTGGTPRSPQTRRGG